VLTKYSRYYDTKTFKMYMSGNRRQRQWLIMASRELGLMPTTEGGLEYRMNLTHAIDGYPGIEHSLPIVPAYNDVVELFAESGTVNSPTLLVTYALYYLGRVNISLVLPALALDLGVSRAEVGALGTIFFWVYGIFHFVSGEIGSHVSPFRLVSIGLLASAIVNLVFAFQSSLIIMLVLWGLNGVAQSGGWSPMFRILAERLDRVHIKRVSTVMPFSYVIGTALTWVLIGTVAAGESWRIAFWLPGLMLLAVFAFWRKAGIDAPKTKSGGIRLSVIISEARGIAFVMLAAALGGFVFNGTILWLPSYILDTNLFSENLVGAVAALTQVIAIAGLFLARYFVARSNQVFVTAATMFSAAALAFLLLTMTKGGLAILVVAFALLALNGAFGLTVSSMPLLLARSGRASSRLDQVIEE